MTSSAQTLSSDSGDYGLDEQKNCSQFNLQSQTSSGNLPLGIAPPSTQFMMPCSHTEMSPNSVQAAYPFVDPYYGGIVAAYSDGHAVVHPYYVGVQPGLPLPSETVEEPVYVNAKQYRGILRRRQSRAKAESENKLLKNRKPYLHESRHLHALKRARGCGGRFLTAKDDGKKNENSSIGTSRTCNDPCSERQENAGSNPCKARSSTAPTFNCSSIDNETNGAFAFNQEQHCCQFR